MSHVADERIRDVLDRLTELLRSFIEGADVSEHEWMAALGFLTEVGRADEFILLSDVLGLSVFINDRTHPSEGGSTASNVVGPFHLPDAPVLTHPHRLDDDDEPGERLIFEGRVTDARTGRPIPGAVLDVWQADDGALYDLQRPGGAAHLRGRFPADASGDFQLRTIVPPPYEIPKDGPVGRLLEQLGRHAWRPAHLHVKVVHPEYEPLTTMVYFEGDPWLGSDTIGSVKRELVTPLQRYGADERCERAYALCRFDIALIPAATGAK